MLHRIVKACQQLRGLSRVWRCALPVGTSTITVPFEIESSTITVMSASKGLCMVYRQCSKTRTT